jgi:Domain of unknown function (DUF5916)
MNYKLLIISFLAPFFTKEGFAQSEKYAVEIRKTTNEIVLDGEMNEPVWQNAQVAKNFKVNFPIDSVFSLWQTEARFTFDDKNLYIGYVCFQKRADYTVQNLRRDFGPGTTDVINLMLDPSRDGLNGFLFSVSPLNVQREATIINGQDFNIVWDNKWFSEIKNFDDKWTVEIAIPFKTLRYKLAPDGQQNCWGLNFIRTRLKNFETSTWSPVPQQFRPTSLAFEGQLIWVDAPPRPGVNISLIPYATTGFSTDFQRNTNLEPLESVQKFTKNIGGDAKIGITPSLNLDLTFNPDFSQVEVDRQVANVSRFELFFPETRQFFIENQDLFGMFGFPTTRPFFSRRIGLSSNPLTGQNEKIPILAGARLSGKLTDKLRIGLLNMTTDRKDWDATHTSPSANFSVLTLQQRVFARSTLGAIFVNKENFLNNLDATQLTDNQPFNRVAGLEYNLYSKDNKWTGEAYYHQSFSPDPKKRGETHAIFLGYGDRNFNARLGYFGVDSSYTADAGFVPRNAIHGFYPGAEFFYWPKKSSNLRVSSIGFDGGATLGWKGEKLDYNFSPFLKFEFKNQGFIQGGMYFDYTYLYEPFDPTRLIEAGELPLPIGAYSTHGLNFDYSTGTSGDFQVNFNTEIGQYYKGSRLRASGDFAYRLQPIGLFSMNFAYFDIKQPAPYPSARFYLIGPKAEISFRRDLFLSTFLQYNTQTNNVNINARLQWRFAPVSDLFLVYTDNSYASEISNTNVRFFTPKSRAIVLKAVYWLNL